jgi:hypothetical protein
MSESRTVPKGSDLLVAALENEGVEYVFGIPGEENLDVVESLRQSRIALVLTRHEQAAFHGSNPWAPHRPARGLPDHAWTGRA